MAGLASGLLVSALMRQASHVGGFAMLLQRGDEQAGAILLSLLEKGRISGVYERILGIDGAYQWTLISPQAIEKQGELDDYLGRRRRSDPDLWLVELDIPDPARFIAEMPLGG